MARGIDPGLKGAVVRAAPEKHLTPRGWEAQPHITMPPELFEQYRQGWRCPSCHTVQDEALPKVCKTVWKDTGERCGYPIRDRLHEWLNVNFRGEETLWPDREDEINQEREIEEWGYNKALGNGTTIWLPGDD